MKILSHNYDFYNCDCRKTKKKCNFYWNEEYVNGHVPYDDDGLYAFGTDVEHHRVVAKERPARGSPAGRDVVASTSTFSGKQFVCRTLNSHRRFAGEPTQRGKTEIIFVKFAFQKPIYLLNMVLTWWYSNQQLNKTRFYCAWHEIL